MKLGDNTLNIERLSLVNTKYRTKIDELKLLFYFVILLVINDLT